MRCPECRKFVSFDSDQEPEVEIEIDEDGAISGSVRIVNACGECGMELTEASFDVEVEADASAAEHKGDGHEFEVEESGGERTEDHRPPGRPARYQKTFYGYSLDLKVTCKCGKYERLDSIGDEIQASGMDELE